MPAVTGPTTTTDVESCVARFEAAWFAGGEARLAEFLPPAGAAHFHAALIELACSDLELTWAAGGRRQTGQGRCGPPPNVPGQT